MSNKIKEVLQMPDAKKETVVLLGTKKKNVKSPNKKKNESKTPAAAKKKTPVRKPSTKKKDVEKPVKTKKKDIKMPDMEKEIRMLSQQEEDDNNKNNKEKDDLMDDDTVEKKKTYLSVEEKLRAVEAVKAGCAKKATARLFGVQPNQIRAWCEKEEELRQRVQLNPNAMSLHSGRPLDNKQVEEELFDWILQQRLLDNPITSSMVIDKALLLSPTFHGGSRSRLVAWVYNYLGRKRLSLKSLGDSNGYNSPNEIQIPVHLPGYNASDIHVQVEHDDRVLHIFATRTMTFNNNNNNNNSTNSSDKTTRETSTFDKCYTIASHIDAENITATCLDGVLTLTAPKGEKKQKPVRKITVTELKPPPTSPVTEL